MWRTVPGSELLSSWFTGSSQHGFSKGKSDLSNPLQWNDCQELKGEQHCLPRPLPLSQKMLGNDDGQSLPPARCRWHKLGVADTAAAPAAIPRHLCRLEKWAVEEESCPLTHPGAIQLLKPLCREGPGLLEMDRRQQGAQTRLMAWAAPAGWQRWSFPFLTQEQCPGWHTQTQLKATKGFRDCSTSLTRKGWGSRDCLARRKLRETLIKHIPSSEGECKHGARHSLEHVSFPLSPRTHSYCEAGWELQSCPGTLSDLPWRPKAIWTSFWPARPRWDGWSREHGLAEVPPNLNQPLILWIKKTQWKFWKNGKVFLFFFKEKGHELHRSITSVISKCYSAFIHTWKVSVMWEEAKQTNSCLQCMYLHSTGVNLHNYILK